jgi:hypothetical protein
MYGADGLTSICGGDSHGDGLSKLVKACFVASDDFSPSQRRLTR